MINRAPSEKIKENLKCMSRGGCFIAVICCLLSCYVYGVTESVVLVRCFLLDLFVWEVVTMGFIGLLYLEQCKASTETERRGGDKKDSAK